MATKGGLKKLKLLSLHGYLQHGSLFSSKIGSFRKGLKSRAEFVFLDAPFEVTADESDLTAQAGDAREGGRCWWRWSSENGPVERPSLSTRYTGFRASLERIVDAIESERPDGLLGFSMGGTTSCLALSALALISAGELDVVTEVLRPHGTETAEENAAFVRGLQGRIHSGALPLPRFALVVGGFHPLDAAMQGLLRRGGATPLLRENVPVLFVSGDADPLVPRQRTLDLMEHFPRGVLVTHPGGHMVPTCSGGFKAEVTGFLDGVAPQGAEGERRESVAAAAAAALSL